MSADLRKCPEDVQPHVPALFRVELRAEHVGALHACRKISAVVCYGSGEIRAAGCVVGMDEIDAVAFLYVAVQPRGIGEDQGIPAYLRNLQALLYRLSYCQILSVSTLEVSICLVTAVSLPAILVQDGAECIRVPI